MILTKEQAERVKSCMDACAYFQELQIDFPLARVTINGASTSVIVRKMELRMCGDAAVTIVIESEAYNDFNWFRHNYGIEK